MPHFEKMLYDNAQASRASARRCTATRRVRTAEYLIGRPTSPLGGFCTAEAARRFLDVYQLQTVPHGEAALRAAAAPVVENDAVLQVRHPVSEALAKSGHDRRSRGEAHAPSPTTNDEPQALVLLPPALEAVK